VEDLPRDVNAAEDGVGLACRRLSKFQSLLPLYLEERFLTERLFDIAGLQEFLSERWIAHRKRQKEK
jgi:hypothetical protein